MSVCLSPNGPISHQGDAPPTRVWVATTDGVACLERVSDAAPWRLAGRSLGGHHIGSLLFEPTHGALYAGAHSGGLFRSTDGGASWESRTNGLTIGHVFSLGSVATPRGVTLYAGTEPVSLFRSDDEGRSWRELPAIGRVPGTEKWSFPPPPHIAHTKSFCFDPRDADTFYAAIEQGALLKTTDGGRNWRELASYYRPEDRWYRDIHRVVMAPSDPDKLYMTTGMGLYVSADAGESWEQLTELTFRIGYPDHLVISPADERVMFMSGAGEDPSAWRSTRKARGTATRSRDGGRSWQPADRGLHQSERPNIEAMCLASHPGGFALFAANTDGEVYCSEDGAESWTRIAVGLAPISKVGHYRNVQTATA